MNEDTLLLRQIHPNFIQDGRVSSQAFRPSPKDEMKLSVYDGDQIRPQPAHTHYVETLGLQSAGIMGVSVSECSELELSTVPDPAPFPEHALIDFSSYAPNQREKKAKLLRARATSRDWLFKDDT